MFLTIFGSIFPWIKDKLMGTVNILSYNETKNYVFEIVYTLKKCFDIYIYKYIYSKKVI